jgi:hypothetical protein
LTAGATSATAAGLGTGIAAGSGAALGAGVAPTVLGALAGNMAGRAVEAAITGRPIDQALLTGVAQTIPFSLGQSADFRKLPQPVQDVLSSTAQAAVMGQDVETAAVSSLLQSTQIVAKAINEVPELGKLIQDNPTFGRYVVGATNSALMAKLLDKDVNDAVIGSLARTTGQVMMDALKAQQAGTTLSEAQKKHQQLEGLQKDTNTAAEKVNNLIKSNSQDINNFNVYKARYQDTEKMINDYQKRADQANRQLNDPSWRAWADQPGFNMVPVVEREAQYYQEQADLHRNLDLPKRIEDLNAQYKILEDRNFFTQYNEAKTEFDRLNGQLTALSGEYNNFVNTLSTESANLFNKAGSAVTETLRSADPQETIGSELSKSDAAVQAYLDALASGAPLSVAYQAAQDAFQREKESAEVPLSAEDQNLYDLIQGVAGRPDITVPSDAAQVAGPIAPPVFVTPDGSRTFEERLNIRRLVYGSRLSDIYETNDGKLLLVNDSNPNGVPISTSDYERITGYPFDPNAGMKLDITLSGPGDGSTGEIGTGVGTGTPGAPPIDYSLTATDMQGTPMGNAPPSPTTLFNLLTSGTGSPTSQNRAIFSPMGGMGVGGAPQETTWSLVARASETGTNDIIDVGGKTYSLILLPDRQVLVPTKSEPVPVFLELYQDPTTKTPIMREVEVSRAPADMVLEIANKIGEPAGGAEEGAQGAPGGREGVPGDAQPAPGTQTTTPPGAVSGENQELFKGVSGDPADVYLYDKVPTSSGTGTTTGATGTAGATGVPTTSGSTTETGVNVPLTPAPAPELPTTTPSAPSAPTGTEGSSTTLAGGAAGTGTPGTPGAGGFGTGTEPGGGEAGVVPGGGTGTGVPGGEGEGPARGEEGTGPGTGTEGTGIGQGGTGTGTGTGEGGGSGEGGGRAPATITSSSSSFANMLGLGALGAAAASGEYKPTTPGETWLGGLFRQSPDTTAGFRRLLGLESEAQEANVYSALRQASGIPDNLASPASFYSYGKETSPADTFKFYRRGGTVQDDPPSDKMPMSPLLMSHGDIPHKGSHYVNGAGGGQDDLIPAQLADGEYVLDAEIVAALGDGSSKEGAKRLDKFREAIRKHKRTGSLKDIPPKAKSPLAYFRSIK